MHFTLRAKRFEGVSFSCFFVSLLVKKWSFKGEMEGKELKDFRKELKMTRKELSIKTGIPVSTIKAYENGYRTLKKEDFLEIKSHFTLKKYDKELTRYMIDYFRFTLHKEIDVYYVAKKFFGFDIMLNPETTSFMKYELLYRYGDIWFFGFNSSFSENGEDKDRITVQLSGQGCRQLELYLESENITWIDFIKRLKQNYGENFSVTRIDIAVDEMAMEDTKENFDLSSLITRYYNQDIVSPYLKNFSFVGGGGFDFENPLETENRQGLSIYLGSRQSEMYFNFYEKRYEIAKKEGISVSDSVRLFGIWNRYEVRFSQGKARSFISEILTGADIAELTRSIFQGAIQIYDGTDEHGFRKFDSKWQRLFGNNEAVRLSVSPEPYTVEKTIRWLVERVSNSLVYVSEIDRLFMQENMKKIMESGEITPRQRKQLDFLQSQLGMIE